MPIQKHFIYIITDSNRAFLEVAYCRDISLRIHEIQEARTALFHQAPQLGNIIHMEEYLHLEEALARQQELQRFTRMQKERLIRLKNPNWLNLTQHYTQQHIKKVAVYA